MAQGLCVSALGAVAVVKLILQLCLRWTLSSFPQASPPESPGLKPLICGTCWLSAPLPLVWGACLPACLHQFHRHSEVLATSHNVARRFNYELPHFIHIYVAKAHRRQNTNKSPGPEKRKAVEQRKQGPKLVSFFSFPFLAKERMKQV